MLCKRHLKHNVGWNSAGNLFVFKGKYRAVLISYPSRVERDELINHKRQQMNARGIVLGKQELAADER